MLFNISVFPQISLPDKKTQIKKPAVEALQGILGAKTEYVPYEIGPEDPWQHGPSGLARKDGKFFKMLFILATRTVAGNATSWSQPLVVREHNQYDRFACDRICGDIVLPVRCRQGEEGKLIEYGITAIQGPGSYGEVTFSAPRASLSNPSQLVVGNAQGQNFEKADEEYFPGEHPDGRIYRRLVRSDVNRLTGRDRIWVKLGDEKDYPRCVWFNVDELARLLHHEQMTDSPTRELLYYVLSNQDRIQSFVADKLPAQLLREHTGTDRTTQSNVARGALEHSSSAPRDQP